MTTRFDDWEGEYLEHHGIKGMKWGVRRYQNEDGSLTEAGKRHIARTAGSGYLNPSYKDIKKGKATARRSVAEQYSKEYWEKIRNGMPKNVGSKEGRQLWDKYKRKYASATLKDLGLNDTKQGRRSVNEILKQIDFNYKYRTPDEHNPSAYKSYAERREEIAHPVKTKLKNKAGNGR